MKFTLSSHLENPEFKMSAHADNPEFKMASYFSSIKYNDPNNQNLCQLQSISAKLVK